MFRGSFVWDNPVVPAAVDVRLVLGRPSCGELVALKASARNCRPKFSCSLTALNRDRSALGTLAGRRLGKRPLSVRSVLFCCWMNAMGSVVLAQPNRWPLVCRMHVLK